MKNHPLGAAERLRCGLSRSTSTGESSGLAGSTLSQNAVGRRLVTGTKRLSFVGTDPNLDVRLSTHLPHNNRLGSHSRIGLACTTPRFVDSVHTPSISEGLCHLHTLCVAIHKIVSNQRHRFGREMIVVRNGRVVAKSGQV